MKIDLKKPYLNINFIFKIFFIFLKKLGNTLTITWCIKLERFFTWHPVQTRINPTARNLTGPRGVTHSRHAFGRIWPRWQGTTGTARSTNKWQNEKRNSARRIWWSVRWSSRRCNYIPFKARTLQTSVGAALHDLRSSRCFVPRRQARFFDRGLDTLETGNTD